PDVDKRLFACRAEGRLAGYMVLKARTRRGLKTMDCADFWEDPAVPGVLESLLAAVRRWGTEKGLDLLASLLAEISDVSPKTLDILPLVHKLSVWANQPDLPAGPKGGLRPGP
ncbi:MAG: hypothetical protein HGA76_09995, partial [Candidatus Firestonebacteria bacterium]|nr:hypothetical protein [Candidatus Firestonebacteria bacterium]